MIPRPSTTGQPALVVYLTVEADDALHSRALIEQVLSATGGEMTCAMVHQEMLRPDACCGTHDQLLVLQIFQQCQLEDRLFL